MLGILAVLSRTPGRFRPEDVQFLTTIGNQIGLGIENARLFKEMEAKADALSASEARFRSLVEQAPDIIFSLDPQGQFVFLNKRVEEILGYTPETLLGRHLTEFCAPESREKAQRILHAVNELTQLPAVLELISPDRTKRVWAEISMVRFYGTHGQVSGVHGSARDITKRQEMEGQLCRSEKLAAVGQLAAGVAHELGNALAIIDGSVQHLLRNIEEGHPFREYLEVTHRSVATAERIIRGLLSFARPSDPALGPVDIAYVLDATCLLLKGELAKGNIAISRRFSPKVPMVIADQEQLQQVFVNLLLNAIQAVPPGGEIALKTFLDPVHERLVVSVADAGPGIPPEHLEKIFEPFFSTKAQGTGLGLAVSHRTIVAHGGEIAVHSEEGRGTTVTIALPFPPQEV